MRTTVEPVGGKRLARFLRDNQHRIGDEVAVWTHKHGGLPGFKPTHQTAGWAENSPHMFSINVRTNPPYMHINIRPLEAN